MQNKLKCKVRHEQINYDRFKPLISCKPKLGYGPPSKNSGSTRKLVAYSSNVHAAINRRVGLCK